MEAASPMIFGNSLLVLISQRIVIAAGGLVLAYLVRKFALLKWLILLSVLAFTIYSAEELVFPGSFVGIYDRLQDQVEVTRSPIPAIAKIEADRALIARMGSDNFSKFLIFDKNISRMVEDSAQRREYQVGYHLLAVRDLTDEDAVYVTVVNEVAQETVGVPDCVLLSAACSFLSRKEVFDLLRAENIDPEQVNFEVVKSTEGFEILASDCEALQSWKVDYISKNVSQTGLSEICGK